MSGSRTSAGCSTSGSTDSVGVIANGAGLAMSTVDIVNQVGGSPANFLDIGGGANADVMAGALEVITSDANVRSIFINIFGGITKGEEVANGIVQALERVQIDPPIVIRLDGTNADEGRAILEPHLSDKLRMEPTMVDAAAPSSVELAEVSIFVDETTKVVYQGLTGGQGSFYGPLNRDVRHAGRRRHQPEEGGHRRRRHPVFATVADAIEATGANASCIFIPAPGVTRRGDGSRRGGHRVHRRASPKVCPRTTRRGSTTSCAATSRTRGSSGPNCPGIISPGKCNIGITAGHIAKAGGPVGIVSRSGTLTYQALYELKQKDIGVTTCVGIGGDPVPGTSFIDCLRAFEADPETKAVMMIGEIGGSAEEEAADFIKTHMSKPVVAYVAGVTAPPGKKMGHAGAIVSGGKGTADAKIAALRDAGAQVGLNPTEAGELMAEIVAEALTDGSGVARRRAEVGLPTPPRESAVEPSRRQAAASSAASAGCRRRAAWARAAAGGRRRRRARRAPARATTRCSRARRRTRARSPPTPHALLGAMSTSTATSPPNTVSTPIHVVARRWSPWRADDADDRARADREQAAEQHALVAAEHDRADDRLERADRDERRGRALELAPVEHARRRRGTRAR